MPQAGNLTPPTETQSSLRHVATAPNLRFHINRYANLDADSPAISVSPPTHPTVPVKFFPIPSKYGQLSGMTLSSNLSTSPKREMEFHQESKPSFTVGHDESHEDHQWNLSSRLQIPTTIIHTCDSTAGTPQATPSGSPSLLRRVLTAEPDCSAPSAPKHSSGGGGFFGWLTKPGPTHQEEASFFHQKEDMPSVLTTKARLIKPRPKMPVSMSDVNVFTPTEY